jgi:hypothetical protein
MTIVSTRRYGRRYLPEQPQQHERRAATITAGRYRSTSTSFDLRRDVFASQEGQVL